VKPPIRLLAIDIDGTLLNSKTQISEPNLRALRRTHETGVEVVLVTGRRHQFALPIAQQLGFDLCLISSNGAITKSLAGELFHREYLPVAIARRLCQAMGPFTRNMVVTFDREGKGALIIESPDGFSGSISGWMTKNAAFIDSVSPIEQCLTCDPIQAMFCGPVVPMREAAERLAASDVGQETTALRTEYPHRDLSILDVLRAGCTKGAGVERWARQRGISREQVMAIGDNFNDLEMLEFAGHPVIMGNACEELKRSGWHVTASNDEHGVAAAIEMVLGRATPVIA
jgi:Cof subfamily protein (haloacid dehalogenase superfamily)